MEALAADVWVVLITERIGNTLKRQNFMVEGIDASLAIHTAKIQARKVGFVRPKNIGCHRVPHG